MKKGVYKATIVWYDIDTNKNDSYEGGGGMARYSYKREAILNCVRGTKTHPSADWVFAQLKPNIPDLSLGTVYRNLGLFKQQGLVQSVGVVDGLERFDGNTAPHVHFVCTQCAAVVDLDSAPVPQALFEAARQELGAQIEGCEVNLRGICRFCLEKAEKEENKTK